jgi:hypothetical protein
MCYVDHSNRLQEIIKVKGSKSGELIGGHKKDVVLTNMLTNQKYKKYNGRILLQSLTSLKIK